MRCLADIRLDNLAIARVRRYTRETLPDWCENMLGSHLLVFREEDGEFYCQSCGRVYYGGTEKRPRRQHWRPEGAPMMRQVRMAL